MVSRGGIKGLIYIVIIAILLDLLIGAFHTHHNSKNTDDCAICVFNYLKSNTPPEGGIARDFNPLPHVLNYPSENILVEFKLSRNPLPRSPPIT